MKHSLLQTLIYIRMDLIKAAKQGKTVPYKRLMKKYGIVRGNTYGQGIGWVVGHVSEYEHQHGRPLLSAIVVRSNSVSKLCPQGHPGTGFLRLDGIRPRFQRDSRSTGPLTKAEQAYIHSEQQRVWNYWKRHKVSSKPLKDLLNR